MSNIINEAINIQLNEAISKLKFDKTIIAKVKGNIRTEDGQILKDRYLVEYSGSSGFPVWGNGGTYNIDDMVYVKIPEGDFASENKIIEGKVLKEEDALWGSSIKYIPAAPVLIENGELDYGSSKEIVIQDTIANKDIANFEYNANKYGAIKIKFNLKFDEFGTSLGLESASGKMFGYNSQPTIGLRLIFMGTDGDPKNVEFTNLSGDNPAITGHQFFYPNWSTQEIIYDIPDKEYLYLYSVDMVYDILNSMGQEEPALYKIDNLKIEFVDSIDISAEDNYYVGIAANNGYFYEAGDSDITATATNYVAGKENTNQVISTLWYKFDKDSTEPSDLGTGWQLIENTPNNILTHDTSLLGKTTYAVSTVFSDNTRKTDTITFTEIKWKDVRFITQDTKLKILGIPEDYDISQIKWQQFNAESNSWTEYNGTQEDDSGNPYIEATNGILYKAIFNDDKGNKIFELEQNFIAQIGIGNIPTPPTISVIWGGDPTVYKYDANGRIAFGDSGKLKERELIPSFIFSEDSETNFDKKYYYTRYKPSAENNQTELIETPTKETPCQTGTMFSKIWLEDNKIKYRIRDALISAAAQNWVERTSIIVKIFKKDTEELITQFKKDFTILSDGNNGTNGTNYFMEIEWDKTSVDHYIVPKIYKLNETNSNFEQVHPQNITYQYIRQPAYYSKDGTAYYNHDYYYDYLNIYGKNDNNAKTELVNAEGESLEGTYYAPIWGYVIAKIKEEDKEITISAFYNYHFGSTGYNETERPNYSAIQYSAGGTSPIGQMYDDKIDLTKFSQIICPELIENNNQLKFSTQNLDGGEAKLVPPSSIGDKNIALAFVLKESDIDDGRDYLYSIVLYKNAYGDATLNAWDGTTITAKDGYILAPTVSAGRKNADNTFTGVVMGQDSRENLIGLYGYGEDGTKTFSLTEQGNLWLKGEVEATGGNIGNWQIEGDYLYKPAVNGHFYGVGLSSKMTWDEDGENAAAIWAGYTAKVDADKAPHNGTGAWQDKTTFYVTHKGKLKAKDADIEGTITATGGNIAGFSLTEAGGFGKIDNNGTGLWLEPTPAENAYFINCKKDNVRKFSVNASGQLYAKDADIEGKITATSGTIAGFTIEGDHLIGNQVGIDGAAGGYYAFWAGARDASGNSNFMVGHDGTLHATGARISGTITATGGKIAGLNITTGGISYWSEYSGENTNINDYNWSEWVSSGNEVVSSSAAYQAGEKDNYKGVYYVGIERPQRQWTNVFGIRRYYAKGESTWTNNGNYDQVFLITTDGKLYAQKATITGDITATSFKAYSSANYQAIYDDNQLKFYYVSDNGKRDKKPGLSIGYNEAEAQIFLGQGILTDSNHVSYNYRGRFAIAKTSAGASIGMRSWKAVNIGDTNTLAFESHYQTGINFNWNNTDTSATIDIAVGGTKCTITAAKLAKLNTLIS